MTFQIHALPVEPFAPLFALSDAALLARNARRMRVDASPGFPCRVSLVDAAIGETVILLNYEHQPRDTPYRAAHAIFVREGVRQAFPEPGEIPDVLLRRLISLRAFDARHDMVAADVADGRSLGEAIARMLAEPAVDYLHLHNAKPGCYAAAVTRTGRASPVSA